MKKIKYLFVILLLVFGIGFFGINETKTELSAQAALTYGFSSAVTFSIPGTNEKSGMVLDDNSNFKVTDDGKYIIATSGEITANFSPLLVNYGTISVDDEDNYYVYKREIVIQKDEDWNDSAAYHSFEFDGTTYYFAFFTSTSSSNYVRIYTTAPASTAAVPTVDSTKTTLLSYTNTDDAVTFTLTMSYTLKSNAETSDEYFTINVPAYSAYNTTLATTYSFEIFRPSIQFADKTEQFVEFTDGNSYIEPWLKNDTTFSNLTLKFLNSSYNYTENSPLYFNINYNGFIYEFKLYSADGNLYVEYTDEENSDNNRSVASILGTAISNTNQFSITFKTRGRYVIEFFDDTYVLGMNTANYYKASFYIAEEATTAAALYENIYIYAETIETDDAESEYIVHSAVENVSVKATVKNLNITSGTYSLKDVISYISISKTLYGASDNINYMTFYLPTGADLEASTAAIKSAYPSQDITIYENLEDYLDENGDFIFTAEEDAQYQVTIHPLSNEISSSQHYFTFTVIKNAITVYVFEGETYTANSDFSTAVKYFTKSISTSDPMKIITKYGDSEDVEFELNKTYVNKFSVSLGNEKVEITGDTSTGVLVISVYGVGDLTVQVTFDGETVTYNLNYEKGDYTLTFSDYGTYSVTMTDAIGTTTNATYSLVKSLNTSSIILIALSAIILAAVVAFVLISRKTPKTR